MTAHNSRCHPENIWGLLGEADQVALRSSLRQHFRRLRFQAADAEDLTQETLLVMLTRRPQDVKLQVGGFATGVARRLSLRHWRGSRSRARLLPRWGDEASTTYEPHRQIEEEHDHEVQQATLRRAIARLQPQEQDILSHCSGTKPMAQVAVELGLSPEAVRQRYSRAKRRLRALLATAIVLASALVGLARVPSAPPSVLAAAAGEPLAAAALAWPRGGP